MKNLKRIIFILLIILPLRVFADYEHFKLWDMSDGLSNNTVKSITQDHLGFIWLGTFDGLCKFDGVDFTIFRHDSQDSLSIINNYVEVVASLGDELWVGTERGLNLYSYKENNFRLCEWILPTGERQKITESIKNIVVNQESVFILTFSHQLLVRKEGCVFEPCDYKKNIEWLSISGYKEGLLIGHATDGLYVIDPDEMRIRAHFPFDSKILSDCLYYSTNKDMIFLGFGIGYPSLAFRMNKENSLEKLEVRIPSSVKTIVDYKDETLFGTDGNGLMVFNESGCSDISSGESDMSSDAIYSLFVDRSLCIIPVRLYKKVPLIPENVLTPLVISFLYHICLSYLIVLIPSDALHFLIITFSLIIPVFPFLFYLFLMLYTHSFSYPK